MNKYKQKVRKINVFRLTLLVIILFIFITAGIGTGFVIGVAKNMSDNPIDINPEYTSFVYDIQDEIVFELHGVENRIPLDIEEIPEIVQKSFIAAEDHRFRKHFGVDVSSFGRVVVANITRGWGAEGGSTITMQLARNAILKSREKVIQRKIQEIILAIKLERVLTKDQILEAYLNQIYFGEGASGIQSAAQAYFNKSASDLTIAESALLAGIIQRPATLNPFKNPDLAENRRNQVLERMYRYNYITEEEMINAKQQPIELTDEEVSGEKKEYAFYRDLIIEEASKMLEEKGISLMQIFSGGLNIYTSMDTTLQDKLEEVYAQDNYFPQSTGEVKAQSAAVFIDHRTGQILALMGGREHLVQRGLNRAVDIRRQPGSAMKPLAVYAPALENGYVPSTVIDDVPVVFPNTPRPYSPRNFDYRWRGLITMRAALRDSVNIPAVKMLNQIGVETGYDFSNKLGLQLDNSDRNLSLAVGGLTHGVSPLQVASAYGSFANQGVLVEPYAVRKITDSEGNILAEHTPKSSIVMTEHTAYFMTDMLKNVIQSGTGTRARLNRPAAGKTGSTQLPSTPEFQSISGTRDAWFAGYTPEITGVVWMGYDNTTPQNYLRNVYGGGPPATIWRTVIHEKVKNLPVRDFHRPEGIISASVDAKSGKLPSELTPEEFIINDIFTQKTLPKEVSEAWIEKEICIESGKLAADYCPDRKTEVFLNRIIPYTPPSGYEGVYPEDWKYTPPKETCDFHDEATLITVKICVHPDHEDEPKLALIPKDNQEGGCHEDYIIEKQIPLPLVPKEYCDHNDHQLIEGASPENGENGENKENLNISAQVISDENNSNQYFVELTWSSTGGSFYIIRWSPGNEKRIIDNTNKTKYIDKNINSSTQYFYQISSDKNKTSPTTQVKIP